MEKVTKNARIADLESRLMVMQTQINSLIECGHSHTKRLIALEPDNPFHGKFYEPSEPKLKQLDQSVFDGLDEKWRFAVVDANGRALIFTGELEFRGWLYQNKDKSEHIEMKVVGTGYDTSNWQNSLIERDIAKELLEVDLSSELTGSDLCRKMLERGDRFVMCMVDDGTDVICDLACFVSSTHPYIGRLNNYRQVTPINNQGEPLTAAEAGL